MKKSCFICACPGRKIFLDKFAEAGKDPKDFGWRGIRTQDYTYVMELGYDVLPNAKRYLYHTKIDPEQRLPLDLTEKETRKLADDLESRVLKWMKKQKDGFANVWEKTIPV